jgi:hypothetical protein
MLIPVSSKAEVDRRKVIEEIRFLRRSVKLSGLSIRKLIEQGRRF